MVKSLQDNLRNVTRVENLNIKISDLESGEVDNYVVHKCNLRCSSKEEYQTLLGTSPSI